MPKFHCVHCDQHIDAPGSLAGIVANCPTCNGSIEVPKIEAPTITPQVLETDSKTKKESGGAIFTFIVVVLAGAMAKTCVKQATQTNSHSNYTQSPPSPAPSSYNTPPAPTLSPIYQLEFFEFGRLKIKLPSRPSLVNMDVPVSARNSITSHEVYLSKLGELGIQISHIKSTQFDANMDRSCDGAISAVNKMNGVSSLTSSKEASETDGFPSTRYTINFKLYEHSARTYGLVFTRGRDLWVIQIIAPDTSHQPNLEHIRDTVFSSITVLE